MANGAKSTDPVGRRHQAAYIPVDGFEPDSFVDGEHEYGFAGGQELEAVGLARDPSHRKPTLTTAVHASDGTSLYAATSGRWNRSDLLAITGSVLAPRRSVSFAGQ